VIDLTQEEVEEEEGPAVQNNEPPVPPTPSPPPAYVPAQAVEISFGIRIQLGRRDGALNLRIVDIERRLI
jgi:hypothetical protein